MTNSVVFFIFEKTEEFESKLKSIFNNFNNRTVLKGL